jgi:hypothetical protein
MKKLNKELTLIASQLTGKNGRVVIAILTVALFVLSAGAPSATISIGK